MDRKEENKDQAGKAVGLLLAWAWDKVKGKIFKKKEKK